MALLTNAERQAVTDQLMREMSAAGETCNQVKTVVRTLIDDLDAWTNTNASAVNLAVSLPARSLALPVKARAFQLVIRERYLKGV